MNKTYYITTPLYYVNDKPHIGHSYTNILCDTFARFKRFSGCEVFFLTGTDEHGGKIEKTAREKGKDVWEYIESVVPRFKSLWKELDIRYDYFIRTTDEAHKKVVCNVLNDLYKKGDIYQGKYRGWYCTPCESFWSPLQLKEGKCPDCGRAVQALEEDNFFFKLSKYQSWLVEYIKSHKDLIFPSSRRQEVLSFLERPLEDLCVSRPKARLPWGIPLPFSPDHVVYVWFDALLNYISAISYGVDNKRFKRFWPADLQMIGKDILRQHVIYWPIMLKAIGIEPSKTVLAHGWWTTEGEKVSKSKGNIIEPEQIVVAYGVDAFRYFLLREVRLGLDGSYSEELLENRFNCDLANDLGNLLHRSLAMVEKYSKGVLPKASGKSEDSELKNKALKILDKVAAAMDGYDPKTAVEVIWSLINEANRFVEVTKPWLLAKDTSKKSQLDDFQYDLCEALRFIGVILSPFLPHTSSEILKALKVTKAPTNGDLKKWGQLKPGNVLKKGKPLFPKKI